MNTGIDAGIGVLLRCLREAGERARDAGEWSAAGRGEANVVVVEESSQHMGYAGACNGMPG